MIYRTSSLIMMVLCLLMMLVACGGTDSVSSKKGGNGQPSTVTARTALPPGDPHCPDGGAQIDVGIDDNGNGVLDPSEVDATEYVCNGADGSTSLINTTGLLPGDPNCPDGGAQVEVGIDDNDNGVLDPAEVDDTEYVCNGTDGGTSLINTTGLLPGDPFCPDGGYQVDSGLDLDDDNILDVEEITSTVHLCNNSSTPLIANAVSPTQIDLSWPDLAGGLPVAFFDIYRNGSLFDYTTGATSYSAVGLMTGTLYCFRVVGLDGELNVLVQSPEVCTTTGGSYWVRETSIPEYLTERTGHTAVWTGSGMLVWGGAAAGAWYNNGGIYDRISDSWAFTSPFGPVPSPRSGHTAVWTGSEMIVWGGYDGSYLFTGGRYDPDSDSWLWTSSLWAPSPRSGHTAVWIGSEMLVWGGYDGSFLNTGGRYDPGADTWGVINTTGAPSERDGHTAVWTGSEMLVWGGYDGVTPFLDDGARYNPATDTWGVINSIGSPGPRYLHTAVWTGSKMIVWGGYDYGSLNTGGIYDPATDSWALMNTVGAPEGRIDHTAVWTGSKMIVWGGYDGATTFNTGGIYDPATDTWEAIDTSNAPSARAGHTAIWTGSDMVIWGGNNPLTNTYFATGGILRLP